MIAKRAPKEDVRVVLWQFVAGSADLDGPTYRLTGTHPDDATVTAPPFEAFGLELGALWAM